MSDASGTGHLVPRAQGDTRRRGPRGSASASDPQLFAYGGVVTPRGLKQGPPTGPGVSGRGAAILGLPGGIRLPADAARTAPTFPTAGRASSWLASGSAARAAVSACSDPTNNVGRRGLDVGL